MLSIIRSLKNVNPSSFRPLIVNGELLGHVKHTFADDHLSRFPFFSVDNRVVSIEGTKDCITEELDSFNRSLLSEGVIKGWRDEHYPAILKWGEKPRFTIERAAAEFFGLRTFGVHMNVYSDFGKDGVRIYIARRSLSKPTSPGLLDQCVAGGQPYGISLSANVVKECMEEASIPAEFASEAKPVGTVTYCYENENGLKPGNMFNYDIQLPTDFTPVPLDGEVDQIYLWTPRELIQSLEEQPQKWKQNSAAGCISWLVRHGHLDPDSISNYAELCSLGSDYAAGCTNQL